MHVGKQSKRVGGSGLLTSTVIILYDFIINIHGIGQRNFPVLDAFALCRVIVMVIMKLMDLMLLRDVKFHL